MFKQKLRRYYRILKYILHKETLVDYRESLWSFLGSFIGISAIGFIQSKYLLPIENISLIGSFGATCVLLYGAIDSPLAQPRNLIGGHLISAFIGVTVYKLCPDPIWFSAPLAVSLSIMVMQYTKTLHPPGGATALIAVIGTEKIKSLGYFYLFSPVFSSILILLFVAFLINNLDAKRQYPAKGKLPKTIKKAIIPLRTQNKKDAA